jgi:hypothetical protein
MTRYLATAAWCLLTAALAAGTATHATPAATRTLGATVELVLLAVAALTVGAYSGGRLAEHAADRARRKAATR